MLFVGQTPPLSLVSYMLYYAVLGEALLDPVGVCGRVNPSKSIRFRAKPNKSLSPIPTPASGVTNGNASQRTILLIFPIVV